MPRFCEDAGVSRWLLLAALVGCGRIGFAPPITDGDAGAPGDAPSALRWGLVQTAGSENATVTMKPLGAGHLVVIGVEIDTGGPMTTVTDNCNSYVALSTANATCSAFQTDLQIFYAFAKPSCQVDTIRVGPTNSVCAVVVWEVSGIRADDPVDTVAVLNDQPKSATPLGPKITTSAAGEF